MVRIIEELLERLAPVLGKGKTHAYWMAYLAAGRDEKKRIETLLQMMAAKDLGIGPGYDSIYLAPPPAEIASAGMFFVGNITCSNRTVGRLCLTKQDINQHSLVAGRSGSGKTTAVFNILCSAFK